ncbi:hypothetical protein [Paraliomyxa miuraensis]|uniref:hypothetical protein n=1 Tax=Paraliomyxa miuraensis TaxID=376150 RepID=UPI00224F3977|nr:hypothetical protein [Paraliomyxa miuraensis]MCX4246353.1 hypothetical protein [Paraliomyxa miuraensis]
MHDSILHPPLARALAPLALALALVPGRALASAIGVAPSAPLEKIQPTSPPAPIEETTSAAPEVEASPGDWSSVFSVSAVQPHLHADGVRVVVVPAGTHSQVEAIAKALDGVLDESRRVVLGRRAARVDLDDDIEIARRVAPQGYDRILVVRAFDVDGRVQAVISVLDGQGRSVDAFVAWSDEPMAGGAQSATLGVREETLEAISPTKDSEPTQGEEPTEVPLEAKAATSRYERGRIVYDSARGRFYPHGNPAKSLEGAEFYHYVGRSDLARKHRVRRGAGWTMIVLGATVALVGGTLAATAGDTKRERAVGIGITSVTGVVLMAGGLPLMLGSPASMDERVRMAEEYNDRLRHSGGRTTRLDHELSLRPTVGPNGGGVMLGGRF